MAWQLAVYAGLLAADYVYHRWIEDPPPIQPPQNVVIPHASPGATIPLVWGRYLVKTPFLAWAGAPYTVLCTTVPYLTALTSGYLYGLDQLFNVAIGFEGGTHRLKGLWAGDVEIRHSVLVTDPGLTVLNGDGTGGDAAPYAGALFITSDQNTTANGMGTLGYIEFLNGAATQTLQSGGIGTRWAGATMIAQGVDATLIPGYRGYLSACLFNRSSFPGNRWFLGPSASVPSYAFEVTSYAAGAGIMGTDITDFYGEGIDSNPMNVAYDILCGIFGKLGIDPSYIDTVSFSACAAILYTEQMGYSRSIEGFARASDVLKDIFRQVDGGYYEDPRDGKIHAYLVRQNYDPQACPVITPINCEQLQNVVIGGWPGIPTRFRVTYPSRVQSYQDDSVCAQNQASSTGVNQANAVGTNGGNNELVLDYRGCCTSLIAQKLVAREQLAQSRPITRLTAIVNRSFYTTNPGDVVAINWPEYGWSGMLFRVARVSRGTLADGRIKLDLIQEYFNISRGSHQTGGVSPGPRVGIGGLPL